MVKKRRKELISAWQTNATMLNNFDILPWLHDDTYLNNAEQSQVYDFLATTSHDMIDEIDAEANVSNVDDSADI